MEGVLEEGTKDKELIGVWRKVHNEYLNNL